MIIFLGIVFVALAAGGTAGVIAAGANNSATLTMSFFGVTLHGMNIADVFLIGTGVACVFLFGCALILATRPTPSSRARSGRPSNPSPTQ